ncbi:MAG: class I SAM-dependent methyltransferase [Candidatus Marinimicrobia bacterium]|nr:class I SAM-dependent methyltransferase [Candidatus Neomarinimicrobiota bacterium]
MADIFYEQGAKPSGPMGKFIGKLMNFAHTGRYRQYFESVNFADNINALDIGCGGGAFVKYLSKTIKTGKIFGVDHSVEMVTLAKTTNRKAIEQGTVEILRSSVLNMPFENDTMDIVTALETIQFWPRLTDSLKEVFRIVSSRGKFFVINQYPQPGTKWFERVQIKSDSQYDHLLKEAGFDVVKKDLKTHPGWIIIEATKKAGL